VQCEELVRCVVLPQWVHQLRPQQRKVLQETLPKQLLELPVLLDHHLLPELQPPLDQHPKLQDEQHQQDYKHQLKHPKLLKLQDHPHKLTLYKLLL
jgi:hypothetical protein